MTTAAWRLLARSVAITIAIGALIDPVWSSTRPAPLRAIAVNLAADGEAAIEKLQQVAPAWDIVTREVEESRLPCAVDERCIVIADGSRDVEIPADRTEPLYLLTVPLPSGQNVAIRSVQVSSIHVATAGSARVSLEREGAIASTELRITDNGAIIGAKAFEWASGTEATVDIPFWPLDAGARRLRVEAMPVEGESTLLDNAIDVGVDAVQTRVPALVFDARPSWASTFVRRALEDDARFRIEYRARVAPSLSMGTSDGRLDAAVLDATGVVIIGGPDALTAADVDLLDRFVRVRGGTLILLPEQRPSGPAARLFPGQWTEHLSRAPERVGPLLASEILRAPDQPLATVLGRSNEMASIVSAPAGNGRIVISGAMDAWRHRENEGASAEGDANAFDRFWRSLAMEGALSGAPLAITVDGNLSSASSLTRFTVRDRRMEPIASFEASAIVTCGDRPGVVARLWPTGTLGEWSGEVSATNGPCRIEARASDRVAEAGFAVAENPERGIRSTIAKFEEAARASGGTTALVTDDVTVARALDADRQTTSQVVSVRPMRASWWIIPFAACLTAEWWLRRREGLR